MRPWALWLISHKMRFVLYAISILCFPIYIIANMSDALKAGITDWKDDFSAIKWGKI